MLDLNFFDLNAWMLYKSDGKCEMAFFHTKK